jgi:hypothetical protein
MQGMTGSSPADLALTFRSLPRRRREALADPDPGGSRGVRPTTGGLRPDAPTPHAARLDALVGRAAALVRSVADPLAIADAIDAMPASAWTSELLDALRSIALELGSTLRDLAATRSVDDEA